MTVTRYNVGSGSLESEMVSEDGGEYVTYDDYAHLEAEAIALRVLLARSYAGPALYSDDGELQDNSNHPFIDFRRDSVDTIKSKLLERGMALMNWELKNEK